MRGAGGIGLAQGEAMPERMGMLRLALSLGAAVCGGAAAQAQARLPGLPNLVPHYKIEALGFRCNDETGYDSPWWAPWISDEVKIAIEAPTSGSVSREFGDVDSGEHRNFAPAESCILPMAGPGGPFYQAPGEPWSCAGEGVPGPFAFTVVMAESDSGFWADCLSDFPFGGCHFGGGVPDANDELIGHATLSFPLQDLAAAMPFVGDVVEETAILGPCHDERGCVTTPLGPSPAEYSFTYRVTRLPDALPPLTPIP